MEETGGFEPPAVQFCKLFLWTSQARLLKISYRVTNVKGRWIGAKSQRES